MILLYFYAETKEMIYESVNLKRVVYEPKQYSFSFQSMTRCTGFANVGPIFYNAFIKIIHLALNKFSIELEYKTCSEFSELTYPEFPFESEAKGNSLIGVHQTNMVFIS